MKGLTISQKLTGYYLLLGIITVITISIFFYKGFKKALIVRTMAQLSSINILKKDQIEEHFKARRRNLSILVKNSLLLSSFYDSTGKNYQKLKKLILENNYKNIFLIDSNLKPIPQSTSLSVDTSFLADALRHLCLYDASKQNGEVSLLIGYPVLDEELRPIGAIVLQEDYSLIEQILNERTGMGNTGETYLVASDGYMRSISRFFPGKNPLTIKVQTEAFEKASNGHEGNGILKDYRAVEVLSAYRSLKILGLQWTIISEIDFEEAMTPVYQVRDYIEVIGLLITLLIIIVTVVLSQTISRPIVKLRETVSLLSKGILPAKTLKIKKSDEIGEMAEAINQLVEGLKRTSHFANEIGNGNFSTGFTPLSDEDILGKNLVQMRDKLKKISEQEKNISQQRTFALVEGQENERRRIARELHDGIGQLLTATKFRVGAIEGQEEIRKEIKNILDETIAEVRRISNNLMPSVLVDFGLEAGLRLLCTNTTKYSDIPVHFNFSKKTSRELNFEINVTLYRIAQEGLNNIIKYSDASLAELTVLVEEKSILMELKDNGKGFDLESYNQEHRKDSNGIRNMRERTQLLNGKFYITSTVDEGTTITITIPLAD